jgi:uncharacterized repeat protein (TIGR04138 family)
MHKQNFAEAVDDILKRDSRYDRDSYYFVREGLDFTLKLLKKQTRTNPVHRHVSGQELLEGLRRYALDQFGPMAKTVLDYWGIRKCDDFGEIVFNMVEKNVLGKTEQDSLEDFKGGFDFEEAFVKPYLPTPRPRHRQAHVRNAAHTEHGREKARSAGSQKLNSGSN